MTIRRKTTVCGKGKEYLQVEIFPLGDVPRGGRRRKRYRETSPAQRGLNERRARDYFDKLAKCNFGRGDFFVTLTYGEEVLPGSVRDAEQDVRNYVRRLKTLAKKVRGRVEYLAVVEQGAKGGWHHHLLVKRGCGLTREELEGTWKKGWSDCKYVVDNREKNLERLTRYMTKGMNGTRRWMSSRGLVKPLVYISDTAISKKAYREMSLFRENGVEAREYFERRYAGYEVVEFVNEVNLEYGGCYIRVRMRKRKGRHGYEEFG